MAVSGWQGRPQKNFDWLRLSCLLCSSVKLSTTCSHLSVPTYNSHFIYYYLVSPCAIAPCMNGGICENVGKGYKCTCAPGYHGDKCQSEGIHI